MAWEDILEAIALGGSRGIGEYMSMREAERDRLEREAIREEERAFRKRQLKSQEEARRESQRFQAQMAGFEPATREEVEGVTFAPEGPSLMTLRESLAPTPMQVPRPEVGPDGRMAGGAMVAPGDTYAARNIPRDSEISMEKAEAPEIRVPGATERGQRSARIGDEYFIKPFEYEPTPEEEAMRDIRGRQAVIESLYGEEMTPEEIRTFSLTGNLPPDRTPSSMSVFQMLREEFPGMSTSELLERSGLGLQRTPAGSPVSIQRFEDEEGFIRTFNPRTQEVGYLLDQDGNPIRAPQRSSGMSLTDMLFQRTFGGNEGFGQTGFGSTDIDMGAVEDMERAYRNLIRR